LVDDTSVVFVPWIVILVLMILVWRYIYRYITAQKIKKTSQSLESQSSTTKIIIKKPVSKKTTS
jgi:hypothetical protein